MQEEFNPIKSILNGKQLKGVTKITTTDVRTGKEKVTVDENQITNAVAQLFTNNLSGLANYTKLLPVRSLFSGVLLFGETLDPRGSLVPTEDVAPLIGHAGTEAHSTANPRRGNPNAVETVIGNTSFKGVWTWDTSQAIGTIKSVALCSGVLGNMGTRPWDTSYTPYQPFNVDAQSTMRGTTYDREKAKEIPIIADAINCQTVSLFLNGTSFEEITCYHDTAFLGISRDIHDFVEKSHRTCSLTPGVDVTNKARTVFNTADYYYVVYCVNNTTLVVCQVDKVTFTKTNGAAVTYQSAIFKTSQLLEVFGSISAFPNTETDFYWPQTDGTSFVKCPFAGGSPTPINVSIGAPTRNMGPIRLSDNLILGENYLVNYDTFYPIAHASLPEGFSSSSYDGWGHIPYEMVAGAYSYTQAENGKLALGLINHNLWVSTKNNLAEARTKDASQVMKVEYTISEE